MPRASWKRRCTQRRDQLDPATVQAVERNVGVIDAAVMEIRRALAADPASPYLNRALTDALQRKLDVLRVATRAAGAST